MPGYLPQPLLDLQARAAVTPGYHAETCGQLHLDLYKYVVRSKRRGRGVIEVGCYKGSSSLVLAYACRELRMPFYTLDINPDYLEFTRELLTSFDLAAHSTFFLGPLSQFAYEVRLGHSPILVFVDGDHSYDAVRADIQAIFELNQRPLAAAFHDYSLRSHTYKNILVDRAIQDGLGNQYPMRRIGDQYGDIPQINANQPAADGSYWEANGSEGMIVELDSLRAKIRKLLFKLRPGFMVAPGT